MSWMQNNGDQFGDCCLVFSGIVRLMVGIAIWAKIYLLQKNNSSLVELKSIQYVFLMMRFKVISRFKHLLY